MSRQTLIADLDGTIVQCGRYYRAATEDVSRAIHEAYGVDPDLVKELVDYLDVWAIRATQQGFQRSRYPRSCGAAGLVVGALVTGTVTPSISHMLYGVADKVFSADYTPFPSAIDALRAYRDAGWQVLVYTKGDPEVQMRKVDLHGIGDVVTAVEVTPKKDREHLEALIAKWDVDVLSSAYVGDSVRDDMTPANAVGLYAVRVETQAEDAWRHEEIEDRVSDVVVHSLADMLAVVPVDGFNALNGAA